jgi:hypothetical protein
MGRGVRIDEWKILEISFMESRVRVRMQITGRTRKSLFKWSNYTHFQTDHWTHEQRDWFIVPFDHSE